MSISLPTPWTVAHQSPVEFFKQDYWSGFPTPGVLSNPGI